MMLILLDKDLKSMQLRVGSSFIRDSLIIIKLIENKFVIIAFLSQLNYYFALQKQKKILSLFSFKKQ
jgi:hypothetical protein